MANRSWLDPMNGNYEDAQNWSGLQVPGRRDNVLLNAQGGPAYTVRLSKDAAAKSLTIAPDEYEEKKYMPTLLLTTAVYTVKKVLLEGRIALRDGAQFAGYKLTNEGSISSGPGTEIVSVKKVINDSVIVAAAGSELSFEGKLKGSGRVELDGGDVDFAENFNQYVSFSHGGMLELAQSADYTKAITGFSTDGLSTLDLDDVGFVDSEEATFSGSATSGVLLVSDGQHTASIHLKGDYLSASFVCSSNGHGGTDVVAQMTQSSSSSIQAFVSAVAGFSAPSSTTALACETWSRSDGLILSPSRVDSHFK